MNSWKLCNLIFIFEKIISIKLIIELYCSSNNGQRQIIHKHDKLLYSFKHDY